MTISEEVITWKFEDHPNAKRRKPVAQFQGMELIDGPDLELGEVVMFIGLIECDTRVQNFKLMYKFLYGDELVYISHRESKYIAIEEYIAS